MNLPPGSRIGPYTITREIARGGQGAVLEARDPAAGQVVALKLLLDDDDEASARFLREAETLSRLDHPNLIKVLDQGQTPGGVAYLALEFVRGQSLSDWVRGAGPPPLDEALRVMADASEALDYCHEQGLVHRDLKPQNILLEAETGRVVVVDFGLVRRSKLALAWSTQDRASLTQEGAVLGTPAYMPPEQISPEFGGVDRRSDVYGLGATLFFLLTGEAPFKAPGVLQLLTRVASDPPPDPRALRPNVPARLAELCLSALAKDPGSRPLTARAFGEALVSQGREGRRSLAPLAASGLVLFAALGALAWGASRESTPPPPASQAPSSPPSPAAPLASPSQDPRVEALARAERLLKGDPREREEAERLLLELAEGGSAPAAYRLGMIRFATLDPEAARWFRQAAEGGSTGGMVNLGVLYDQGLGLPKDPTLARAWFRRGAEAGQATGMAHLGRQLVYGLGGPKDEAQGLKWLERSAALGDGSALLVLGRCAHQGRGMPKDLQRAAQLYESAIPKGRLKAAFYLGVLYQNGEGVPQDLARAAELFASAARADRKEAYVYYAEALLEGEGVSQDVPEGLKWLGKAAEAGDTAAQARLGVLYLAGLPGVPADPPRALDLLKPAAAAGEPEAMFFLGRALLDGIGAPRDTKEGAAWIRRAAEGGDANAMLVYSRLHLEGVGVPENRLAGVAWLEKAAATGHGQAMGLWGLELRKRGDFAAAIPWLTGAALKGDPPAMFMLASCYYKGEGVAKDLNLARKWLRRTIKASPDTEPGPRAAKALRSLEKAESKEAKLRWDRPQDRDP